MTMANGALRNAMTVDVEDYFQVSAFEPYIARRDWDSLPHRVEPNTQRVLDLFAAADIKATFFTLGWVAERYPQLVRRIVDEGHELACHGYQHVRVTQQTPAQFREDILHSKHLLEDQGGVAVQGYRAASYSIGADNLWALDELQRAGFAYSSSIYPIRHDLYGMPEAPRFAFRPDNAGGLLEVPVTTVQVFRRNFPCGGGGFFRLLPYAWFLWAMGRVNGRDGQSCVFYFHPWEIDPDQPRQTGIDFKTRARHYTNLGRMEGRLRRLLRDFRWDRMDRIFLTDAGAGREQ